jgi:hypothetical protein
MSSNSRLGRAKGNPTSQLQVTSRNLMLGYDAFLKSRVSLNIIRASNPTYKLAIVYLSNTT